MNISIGNDHAGTDYKFKIVEFLKSRNIQVVNYGTANFLRPSMEAMGITWSFRFFFLLTLLVGSI